MLENKQQTLTIDSIELDIETFYDLGLSQVPGYSKERVIACLQACKNISTEELDKGFGESVLRSSISHGRKNLLRQKMHLSLQ
ncbi:hypothetical protein SpiGrapes_1119 [Sphaerochaeta pleomorpha str. Grapes]|uniref:Uncharacterized protein n=1 Tax=Sphaerochaeta pleomorpha (strain ATCC BAA-1885 / DSM 22778 / Grapes) TaxID=158190 RepID=G8QS78_SPHPG|nr:hypothetical protein [Sphaerochaeta pleomorpha]AEV28939.1 hypothetical protein SpiGrapes_1119 [Sphaerochaeta pleomorpha str. Grapes]